MAGAPSLLSEYARTVEMYRTAPPTAARTGRLILSAREVERLAEDLAAAGSELSPDEAVDLAAKAWGFRDGRIELLEDGPPVEP